MSTSNQKKNSTSSKPQTPYKDLFGYEHNYVPGQRLTAEEKRKLQGNPMLVFGPGPEDKKCKHCENLCKFVYGKTFHKCSLRKGVKTRWGGPATDHKVNWPSCSMFEQAK